MFYICLLCRNLADTVYLLKEEVTTLHCKLAALSDRLQEERVARNQLQAIVNNCLLASSVSSKHNLHALSAQHSTSTTTSAANWTNLQIFIVHFLIVFDVNIIDFNE